MLGYIGNRIDRMFNVIKSMLLVQYNKLKVLSLNKKRV